MAYDHAAIIGGSVSGLAAAQALSRHFERVTLLERDRLPESAANRRGVPQGHHQHLLLTSGRLILEQFFPGLQNEVRSCGTEALDLAADMAHLTPAGWSPRFRSGITILPCSRELLEWRIRERVLANARIEVKDATEALGLLMGGDGSVTGVMMRPAGRRDLPGGDLRADLVVDASGRGSRLPRWLQEIGRRSPPESVIDAHLGYASRTYRGLPALPDGLRGALIQSAPPESTRGGVVMPIEGGRSLVTLLGRGGDHPPTDEAGFVDFAATLRSPLLYEAIADLEPLSTAVATRATQNRQRHYEQLSDWPDGLVVFGDAVCALNPVYGQGMSTAARGALALHRLLAEQSEASLAGVGTRFQRALARLNAAPWMLATGQDLRVQGVEGTRPSRRVKAQQAYLARVAHTATQGEEVRRAFMQVQHMVSEPASLLRPRILLPVLTDTARGRVSRHPPKAGELTSEP